MNPQAEELNQIIQSSTPTPSLAEVIMIAASETNEH